jgi:hypothetical protein
MRAFVYRVLHDTGLRHNEADEVTRADFLLDKADPVIWNTTRRCAQKAAIELRHY